MTTRHEEAQTLREIAEQLKAIAGRLNVAADQWRKNRPPAAFAVAADAGDAAREAADRLLAWRRTAIAARRESATPTPAKRRSRPLSLPEPDAHE